jgi:hypothetical protein
MTSKLKELLDRVTSWPREDIDKWDEAISQIEHGEMESTSASADELRVIDEADHRAITSNEAVN